MGQLHARLFEKWLVDGTDMTYGEWIVHRQAEGRRQRERLRPGAVVPVSSSFFQQQMQSMANQMGYQQQRLMQGMLGGGPGTLGAALEAIIRR